MANITIPNLPSAIALTGSEQVEVVQSNTSVRTTTQAIANLATVNVNAITSLTINSPLYASGSNPITSTGSIGLSSNGVTNNYLGTMPTLTLKGNNTGSTAAPTDLSVASVMTMLGAAPLASPTFTGTPRAPTPATSDNSTQIATTAFVKAQAIPSSFTRTTITASGGQTTFSVSYSVGSIQVYLNGVMLAPSDYTATSGTSVVLGLAAAAGDIFDAFSFAPQNTTGIVPVVNGGSGTSSLSGYVYGNGTSPFTASTTIPATALSGILAAANGGTGVASTSLMPVTATGSTTARTLANRFADVVNVKDFGAIGDGVADDTAAIQAAINATGIAGGGEIYFDQGTYKVTSALAVAYNNVSFIGANQGGSLLSSTSNSSKILSVTGTWFTLRDMSFDYATTPVAGAVAIYLESQNTTLDNFTVFKSYIGIQLGNGTLSSCGAARVSNFQLLSHVDAGIYGYGSADCFFSNGVINAANNTNAANGNIHLLNANEAFVMNNVDILLGVYSIVTDAISYTTGNRPAYSKFTNVYFDSSSQGTYLNNIVSTSFIGCWFSNGRTGAGYFGCTLNQSDEVSFLGCEFFNCGGGGLSIAASAKRTKVIGCTVESNSYTAGAGVAHGIVTANSCSDFIIANNHCHNGLFSGTQGYGIVLDSNVSNFIVKDNNLLGNAAGPMFVGAVGGGGVIANNLGYAPGITIPTVTASPYTYTAGPYNETAYITGGTVSVITVGGQGVFSSTEKTIELGPNETVTTAYSVAPTIRVMRR